jgi:hypothetical protein
MYLYFDTFFLAVSSQEKIMDIVLKGKLLLMYYSSTTKEKFYWGV